MLGPERAASWAQSPPGALRDTNTQLLFAVHFQLDCYAAIVAVAPGKQKNMAVEVKGGETMKGGAILTTWWVPEKGLETRAQVHLQRVATWNCADVCKKKKNQRIHEKDGRRMGSREAG